MAQVKWYYELASARQGPVSSAELRQMVVAGRLGPENLVWREGLASWVPARTLKGLFDGPGMAPPPVPPPLPIDLPSEAKPSERSRMPWFAVGGAVVALVYLLGRPGSDGAEHAPGPGPDPGTGSSAPDESLARQKAATRRVWNALQQADAQVGAAQYDLPSQKYNQTALAYLNIDLTDADPRLRDHVVDSIRGYRDAGQLFVPLEKELAEVYGNAEMIAEFGSFVGRASNENDPEVGETAGGILFGLFGQAAAEEQARQIQARYQAAIDQVMADLRRLSERDESIAAELEQTYGEAFVDLY